MINTQGELSWRSPSPRHDDYYVHVADQTLLDQRIDHLLTVAPSR